MGSSDDKRNRSKESSKDANSKRRSLSNDRDTRSTRSTQGTRSATGSKGTIEKSPRRQDNMDRIKRSNPNEKIGSGADRRRQEYDKRAKDSSRGKIKADKPQRRLPSDNPNNPKRPPKRKREPKETVVASVGNVDTILVTVIYILVLFGIIMIYSASNYSARHKFGSPYHFASKQFIIAVVGFVGMHILSTWDIFEYTFLSKKNLSWIIYITSIVLLIAVIFLGTEVNGQKRWLYIPGTTFGLQPSEIAKHALIIFLADYLSKNQDKLKDFKFYIKVLGLIAIPVFFTLISNLSTAIVLTVIGVGILFVASPYFGRLVAIGIGGIAAAASVLVVYLNLTNSYHNDRFLAWQDPFAYIQTIGFQTVQSLLAIGSGGAFGLGIGMGRQKLYYIPESHNDIIFAVICEELGFVGASLLLILYCILFWRGTKIAINAKDMFGTLIATGVTIMLAVQTIINVSVTTNTIPNTGIALPFVSYGGTSILFLLLMMGVVLSVSRYNRFSN